MRTSVLYSLLAVALVAGTACKGPDTINLDFDNSSGLARGANVIPQPTDTTPAVSVTFNAASLAYSYSIIQAAPATIDSIALYQVAAGTTLPASATVILCAGAAACAATSGTGTLVGAATNTTVRNSVRGFGTQVVVFTTTGARPSGVARGTMYPKPQD